ncbi:leucyl/phenylalanyl-tRNA--protein transferase [Meiothermus granaticius]|uniref:Leucyl/phenylalanyl-tRNA--protein transferase n=1 Tax=Meiothermus granaticius NBRC 107808 TaxID=1227551 RepID=A0A399F924_9DEIN|nr:leucyl/phenylalanyl-tRNA--protein transferase [Meiothermus granaticius]RIH91131.1 Leucyl/phenylalanyl-tRNA--protein transferase [Meiothermus granaticius NBRC 107808]GEM86718.1 leucyl/phenylalanyl-tRNA--protein transferase [Meiothermus granaticius NBRC 107808]
MIHIEETLRLYARGYFLMDNGEGLRWYRSRVHALIPLDSSFHIPRSLRRALNSGWFESRINADFVGTLQGCALEHGETWISEELKQVYLELHWAGYAHSFETWVEGQLAGGILGIALGGAFIGESMFYRVPEASKVAMVRLVEHLRAQGFELFDAQAQNPHLKRFGAYEVAEREFLHRLRQAVRKPVSFTG